MVQSSMLALIMGILSLIIIIYRIIVLMIPMMMKGIKSNNFYEIFNSLTLLV